MSINKTSFNTWNDVDWGIAQVRVRKIQYRIYEASRAGQTGRMYWLQNKLTNSIYAKLLAVQLVITLNKGKNTAEVDKKVVSTKKKDSNFCLAENLSLNGKSQPIRRVWIDKPGKSEKRPLGIPTLEDRARQALAKLALEPEWEARFEAGSYGSRPGRSCHDAMERIFLALHHRIPKWVYAADIRQCFDRIDDDALLEKINTFPAMEKQIRAWLKAGIMEGYANTPTPDPKGVGDIPQPLWGRGKKGRVRVKRVSSGEITETTEGTLQGEMISPLLANIALHGLENHLKEFASEIPGLVHLGSNREKAEKHKAISVIRYADDFVVIHRNKKILELCIEEIKGWLSVMGLTISENKTFLRDGREGFSFLGFRVLLGRRQKSGMYKVKMYPSRESQALFLKRVRKIIQDHKAVSSYQLIQMLRPVIIGWANYYRFCECSDTFSKLTHLIFQKVRAWVFRRDTRSGRLKIKEKYFPSNQTYSYDGTKHQDNWILVGKTKAKNGIVRSNYLPHMVWVKSRKHVMVKGKFSPFDLSQSIYWSTYPYP